MSLSFYIKSLLIEELSWRTNLSDSAMATIADGFAERVLSRRHTVVPTYLTDEMYEATKMVVPGIDFKTANEIYRAAIIEYAQQLPLAKKEDDQPSFW